MDSKIMNANENRDPMTGEPGAHPVGTGVGATLGGVIAGAATGSVAGPAGTLLGAAIGAVLGGLAGKGLAENIDPTVQDAYWHDNYKTRPYIEKSATYDDYKPAYGFGVSAYTRYPGRTFDEVERDLEREWHSARGHSILDWDLAKPAARDAWTRMDERVTQRV